MKKIGIRRKVTKVAVPMAEIHYHHAAMGNVSA